MKRSTTPLRHWMAPVPDRHILPRRYAAHAPETCPEVIFGWEVDRRLLADPEAAALLYRLAMITVSCHGSDMGLRPETCFAPSPTGESGIDGHPDAYAGADFFVAMHWFAQDWGEPGTPLALIGDTSIYRPAPSEDGPLRRYEYDPPEPGEEDDPAFTAAAEDPNFEHDDYDGHVRDLYLDFVYYIFGHWSRRNIDQEEWEAGISNWGLGDRSWVVEVLDPSDSP